MTNIFTMKKLIALLILLISSATITGIAFIDDQIWNIVFIVIGMIAYAVVGILFSYGVLSTKQSGKDAYLFVFLLLALAGYAVYRGLVEFDNWVQSWPLGVKIAVPTVFGLLSILVAVLLIIKKMKKKQKK